MVLVPYMTFQQVFYHRSEANNTECKPYMKNKRFKSMLHFLLLLTKNKKKKFQPSKGSFGTQKWFFHHSFHGNLYILCCFWLSETFYSRSSFSQFKSVNKRTNPCLENKFKVSLQEKLWFYKEYCLNHFWWHGALNTKETSTLGGKDTPALGESSIQQKVLSEIKPGSSVVYFYNIQRTWKLLKYSNSTQLTSSTIGSNHLVQWSTTLFPWGSTFLHVSPTKNLPHLLSSWSRTS